MDASRCKAGLFCSFIQIKCRNILFVTFARENYVSVSQAAEDTFLSANQSSRHK